MSVDHVTAARCEACGAVSYPGHDLCPHCGGDRFQAEAIDGEGVVVTFTDAYALAVDFETRFLRLAIVELDSGLRVTGQLLDDAPEIGKRVRTTVDVVRRTGDAIHRGLQFVPV